MPTAAMGWGAGSCGVCGGIGTGMHRGGCPERTEVQVGCLGGCNGGPGGLQWRAWGAAMEGSGLVSGVLRGFQWGCIWVLKGMQSGCSGGRNGALRRSQWGALRVAVGLQLWLSGNHDGALVGLQSIRGAQGSQRGAQGAQPGCSQHPPRAPKGVPPGGSPAPQRSRLPPPLPPSPQPLPIFIRQASRIQSEISKGMRTCE